MVNLLNDLGSILELAKASGHLDASRLSSQSNLVHDRGLKPEAEIF